MYWHYKCLDCQQIAEQIINHQSDVILEELFLTFPKFVELLDKLSKETRQAIKIIILNDFYDTDIFDWLVQHKEHNVVLENGKEELKEIGSNSN